MAAGWLLSLLLLSTSAWAQSFSSGLISLPINDLETTSAALTVSNLATPLSANTLIKIKASIDHTFCGDLALSIISPSGNLINLASSLAGDCDFLYQDVTFDDSAPTSITDAPCPSPFSVGYYRPSGSLQSLTSSGDLNGVWTFQVVDQARADVGTIHSWGIEFEENSDSGSFGLENGDYFALSEFFSSINLPQAPSINLCLIEGVTCENHRVVSLSFISKGLSGTISPALGNLTALTSLDLQGNSLQGTIPSELGNLLNLQNLDFRGNQLTGTIPATLGNLQSLSYLSLNDNSLSGTIPSEMGALSSLRQMFIERNLLEGSIPSELGNLPNLIFLILPSNYLSGTIPSELGNIHTLQTLNLYHNNLTGTIPSELGNLHTLFALQLNSNHLTGTVPSELGNITTLFTLYLAAGNFFCPTVDYSSWASLNDFTPLNVGCDPLFCNPESDDEVDLPQTPVGDSITVPCKVSGGTASFLCTLDTWTLTENNCEASCPEEETRLGFFPHTGHGKFATIGCHDNAPGYSVRYCSEAGAWETLITTCPI